MTKKKLKLKKNVVNIITILILMIVMLILFFFAVYIYSSNYEVDYYKQNSNNYSYIIINKVSKTFAKVNGKELHFAEDKNNIYIIAINSNDKRYDAIINENNAASVKAYVMPIKSSKEIKSLVKKNITKFISSSNNEKKYNESLMDYYLDTTVKKYHKFNYVVSILFLLSMVIIGTILKLIMKNKKSKYFS